MSNLLKLSTALAKLCMFIAGLALIALLGVTVLDVILRTLYKLTNGLSSINIKGSVELVTYLLYISLLSAMAASVEKSQIVVELFTQAMSRRGKTVLAGVYLFGFTVIGVLMAIGSWSDAVDALEFGEVTQDLAISKGPIYFVAFFMFGVLAIRSAIQGLEKRINPSAVEEAGHEF